MNFEQIMKLLEAGFTVDEIREMMTGNDPETKRENGDPEPEGGNVDPEPGKSDRDPEPNKHVTDPDLMRVLKELQQSINNLDARIKASNIHDEIDDPGAETVDDYLAEIINPTFKEERKK